jgi:hypothetical protein
MTFDLEAARRGEPIEYLEAYGWVEIKFIGAWADDAAVCQVPWNDTPEIVPVSKIRMAKKREIVRYRVALLQSEAFPFASTCNETHGPTPPEFENWKHFIKWIHHDWQEYEIGANE